MSGTREVPLKILDAGGKEQGVLWIRLLPRSKDESLLLDLRGDPDRDNTLEPVQLMEGTEYRYEVCLPSAPPPGARIDMDRRELFEPDTDDGRIGRLRPGLRTGTIPVLITCNGAELGRVAFEVRSRKLDYISHYRWMLQDIAEKFSEAVMERFAPSEQRFELDQTRDAETLYQRFVFLKTLIAGEEFETAIRQVLGRPHRAWVVEEEYRPPGHGMPAGSALARQIAAAPGARVPWAGGAAPHLPARLRLQRTEDTLDTPENRFVQFALSRWRDVAAEIGRALGTAGTGPAARGRREVAAVVERLDEILSADIFREVGPMTRFPASSQVLQKRAGYRQMLRAYVQFEAAAALTWKGGEDVYSAGQRNVATLYEYWVFLQLVKVVGAICNEGFTETSLFAVGEDGLSIMLKQGQQRLVKGVTSRYGRKIRLEVWFNRRFSHVNGGPSWTMPMRPDCSVRIRSVKGSPAPFEEIWLHFDAKYRVKALRDIFGQMPKDEAEEKAYLEEEQKAEASGTAQRSDLLKMHAYRDAIKRSAGAYVVYPGDGRRDFVMYHEILPGLGAFALRPTEGADAQGLGLLRDFLDKVIDHAASQATQHERERWWVREVHDERFRVERPVPVAPFVSRPPADTPILLGYVKNQKHLTWIHKHRLYNLRADGRTGSVVIDARELAVQLVALYGETMSETEIWRVRAGPTLITRTGMQELEYPDPGSELYHCLVLEPIQREQWPKELSPERMQAIHERVRPAAAFGEPIAATWLDLVRQ